MHDDYEIVQQAPPRKCAPTECEGKDPSVCIAWWCYKSANDMLSMASLDMHGENRKLAGRYPGPLIMGGGASA